MKKSALDQQLFNIYKDVKDSHARCFNFSNDRVITALDKQIESLKEMLENYDDLLPAIRISTESAINSLVSEIEKCREANKGFSVTRKEHEALIADSMARYSTLIDKFTQAGGKGLFDLGFVVSTNTKIHHEKILEKIEDLQKSGADIHIVHDVVNEFENRLGEMYRSRMAVVIPSSQLHLFQESMSDLVEDTVYEPNFCKFKGYFIPPRIGCKVEDNLVEAKRLVEMKFAEDRDPSWVLESALASFGYSRHELSFQGFNLPKHDPLNEGIRSMFENINLYQKRNDHVNGVMPAPYQYTSESKEKLGISDEIRIINIADDVEKYEIELAKTHDVTFEL